MSKEGRYYQDVKAVKEFTEEFDANKALEAGMELLAIKEITRFEAVEGRLEATTRIVYVLGAKRTIPLPTTTVQTPPVTTPLSHPPDTPATQPTQPSTIPSTQARLLNLKEMLDQLPWKLATFDKEGKIMSVGPKEVPDAVKSLIPAYGYGDDTHEYRLSKSGWLNKIPKKG